MPLLNVRAPVDGSFVFEYGAQSHPPVHAMNRPAQSTEARRMQCIGTRIAVRRTAGVDRRVEADDQLIVQRERRRLERDHYKRQDLIRNGKTLSVTA
jgi:hypothetical protein